jgi:C-terminal processing protease CtpA/Prc
MKSTPIWPESSSPGQQISYTDELRYLPKQHVFVPPGKIGVAIDVLNGQPVVHKVRKGSPLEKMLQPNDIIVAIDDEDTSCLSAAHVTNMMVKGMDRVRKITYVRRDNSPSMMDI